MLRNMLKWGFGKALRGSSQGRAEAPLAHDFAPIERRVRTTIPEKRSHTEDLGDLATGRLHLILGGETAAGVAVNETTALGVGAVVACVQILAVMTAKLPIYLYRSSKSGPVEIEKHPAIKLLSGVPSALHTNFELRSLMQTGIGLGGNGYARVYRDAAYQPRAMQWLKPCDVKPNLISRPNGESWVRYEVAGQSETLTRADIVHVRSPLCLDGIRGMSPVRMLRESIGTSLSQTSKAGSLMRNGAHFPGYLVSPAAMKKEQVDDLRAEWERTTTGASAGRPPILNGNLDFKQTNGMSMVDAQFVESRRMELHEIARHYGIPAFMVDSTATSTWGAGIEQQMLGFMNLSLDSWLVNWEQCLAFTLLTDEENAKGFYFRFDRDQLANVAPATRAQFYSAMRTMGVYSPNDIRRKEDEPLISKEDGGDTYGNPNTSAPAAAPKAPEPTTES